MTPRVAGKPRCTEAPWFAHPAECESGGRCVVVNLWYRDGTERWGVPLALVGETVRFHSLFPRRGTLLVPFDELEPESVARAVRLCREDA